MPESLREIVRRRAGARCEYCRLPEAADEWPFHVDHIVARQHGGDDDLDNLCWACSRCNLLKGTNLTSLDSPRRDPIALYHPRRDDWFDHFQIGESRIIGITPQGRATVRLLGVNSSARIELRSRLITLGEF